MVNNLKKADDAQSEAESHEPARIANEGGEGDINVTFIVGVVGVLDKDLDDSHILPGIAMDQIVYVLVNISSGWIDGVADVAHFIDFYHVLYLEA